MNSSNSGLVTTVLSYSSAMLFTSLTLYRAYRPMSAITKKCVAMARRYNLKLIYLITREKFYNTLTTILIQECLAHD